MQGRRHQHLRRRSGDPQTSEAGVGLLRRSDVQCAASRTLAFAGGPVTAIIGVLPPGPNRCSAISSEVLRSVLQSILKNSVLEPGPVPPPPPKGFRPTTETDYPPSTLFRSGSQSRGSCGVKRRARDGERPATGGAAADREGSRCKGKSKSATQSTTQIVSSRFGGVRRARRRRTARARATGAWSGGGWRDQGSELADGLIVAGGGGACCG